MKSTLTPEACKVLINRVSGVYLKTGRVWITGHPDVRCVEIMRPGDVVNQYIVRNWYKGNTSKEYAIHISELEVPLCQEV